MMARKKKKEDHVNHEAWAIPYADLLTLLLAFFVVMYAMSSVNEGKFRVLSDSLIAAFRQPVSSMKPIQEGDPAKRQPDAGLQMESSPAIIDVPEQPLTKDQGPQAGSPEAGQDQTGAGVEALRKMSDDIEQAMADLIEQDLIAVRRGELWTEVEIKTSVLFASGSATLQDKARPVLKEIARIMKDFPNPIRVEGFTDSRPIDTVAFPSNWELSAARAASVVHLFSDEEIDPRRMAAIGYSKYRPVAPNDTPEGRRKNRRVVLVILANASAERLFSAREKLSQHQLPDEMSAREPNGEEPEDQSGAEFATDSSSPSSDGISTSEEASAQGDTP